VRRGSAGRAVHVRAVRQGPGVARLDRRRPGRPRRTRRLRRQRHRSFSVPARTDMTRRRRARAGAACRRAVYALLAACILTGPPATSQVVLDSEERRVLEADIDRYEDLQAARRQELAELEAALGEAAALLQQRIADRNQVSAEL